MLYKRMPIERESPEERGLESIAYNLAESSVADFNLEDLSSVPAGLKLGYGSHRGKKELRELIAQDLGMQDPDQVLITAGAASALFIFYTSLLGQQDHIITLHPNYASNIAIPRAIGCGVTYAPMTFESGWRPDLQEIKKMVNRQTRLVSITSPHNPTGMVVDESTITGFAGLADEKNIILLADETYRNVSRPASFPVAAARFRNTVTVGSLSKAFGLAGIRIGWLATRETSLLESFLAAKEMIHITNPVLEEELAYRFLLEKPRWMESIHRKVRENYVVLEAWLAQEKRLECILPEEGVVCFPRLRISLDLDMPAFHELLKNRYQTLVGPGHWFEMPDRYMRIGFGWQEAARLEKGLQNISRAIDALLT